MQKQTYHSPLTAPAIEAARKAGRILCDGFGKKFTISSKESIHDVVTEFDRAAEEAIISHLKNLFPSHSFLAEESGRSENDTGEICWIIDPLDGTMNFARHIPIFCICIAAVAGSRVETGVIYNPMLDELFVAERGFGAYLNGKRLHVSQVNEMKMAMLATGFPYSSGDVHNLIVQFSNFLKHANPIRQMGSAALALAYIAAGRFDIFWALNLRPWDVAAAHLLIEEAGGKITHFDGSPYDLFRVSNILATNHLLHQQALAFLK
jgi:myo-inositol-1(or 4)-monophosphatase